MPGARQVAAGLAALAVAGAGGAALAAREDAAPSSGARAPAGASATPATSATPRARPAPGPAPPRVVMVRRAGGVPDGWAARLERIGGVARVTRVRRAQALVRDTGAAAGAPGRRVRAGYAVLLDTLAIEPRAYAALLPAAQRAAIRRLGPGRALLSRTSARLRRAARGSTLTLAGGRRLRVVAVVPDGLVRSAELVVSAREGARLGAGSPYLLADARSDRAVRRVESAFEGARSRVSELGPAPWPATRGRVARPVALKARFGEFAVRLPVGADWVLADPAWVARNIASATVPILGRVTCHRRMLPVLRAALRDLVRRDLGHLVDPGDYAGCYAPRRIPGSGTLSLHAWGLAVDLNASRNPQGSPPRQDRRLVRVMERRGFRWGGRWPTVPDGMHFELHEVPAPR